jgi:hypothetical protein
MNNQIGTEPKEAQQNRKHGWVRHWFGRLILWLAKMAERRKRGVPEKDKAQRVSIDVWGL